MFYKHTKHRKSPTVIPWTFGFYRGIFAIRYIYGLITVSVFYQYPNFFVSVRTAFFLKIKFLRMSLCHYNICDITENVQMMNYKWKFKNLEKRRRMNKIQVA